MGLFLMGPKMTSGNLTALLSKIPYYTTIDGALAAVEGIVALQKGSLVVRPLQSYFAA